MSWPAIIDARLHGPMRVGVVAACPFPVPQGSQVYIAQTARALQREGHRVQLLCYAHGAGPDPHDIDVLRCLAVPGHTRTKAGPSWAKPLADALLASEIRRAARTCQWQAVVAHNYEGLAAALFAGIRPIVYMPHNAMADELPCYFGGARWAARAGAWLDRTLPKRADAIVAMHQRLADYLVSSGCKRERITVRPPDAPQDLIPTVPQGDPFVLYTGNLDPYQYLPMLLRAMDIVRRDLPHARLVVATHEKQALPGAEMVHAASFPEVAALLQGNCIVAIPRVSWSGYPIKLLNAMAAGRPVVVCESAAGPVVHGLHGWVVKDGDAEAMAAHIVAFLSRAAADSPAHADGLALAK